MTGDKEIDIWSGYKQAVFDTFPDLQYEYNHATWQNKKGVKLTADLYSGEYFLKSRHVDIWDGKHLSIHNNIIYPKTPQVGEEIIPCFGMDLMGFFDKKVIIVFDFQHPKENFSLSIPDLPKYEGDIRFFEPGNHFSENIYVAYCTMSEVNEHLDMFKKYLTKYVDMLELEKPTGTDTSVYKDFDSYMTKLDPVAGYLSGKFGKDKAQRLVNEFLFTYG